MKHTRVTTNKNTLKQESLKGENKPCTCPHCIKVFRSVDTKLFATIEGKPSYIDTACIADIKRAIAQGATIKPFAYTMDEHGNTLAQGTPKRSNCAYQLQIAFNGVKLVIEDAVYLMSAGYTLTHNNGYYVATSPVCYGGNVLGAFLADTFRSCFIARNIKMNKATFTIKALTHEQSIVNVLDYALDLLEDESENETETFNRKVSAKLFRVFTDWYRGQHMGKKGFTFPTVANGYSIF